MHDDEIAAHIVKELAHEMATIDLTEHAPDDLMSAVLVAYRQRRNTQIIIGQLGAELHRRDKRRYSIRNLARELSQLGTPVSKSTVHRWIKPFTAVANS